MRTRPSRNRQSGGVMVETTVVAVVVFGLLSFIFDFCMLAFRHALLVDVTQRTVQDVTRDPDLGFTRSSVEDGVETYFRQYRRKLTGSNDSVMEVSMKEVNCSNFEVSVSTKWQTSCIFCWGSRFQQTLRAKSVGKLESPDPSFTCS